MRNAAIATSHRFEHSPALRVVTDLAQIERFIFRFAALWRQAKVGQADLGGETAEGALRTEEGVVCSTTLLACSAAVCTSESGLILAALIAQVFVEGGVVEQDGL